MGRKNREARNLFKFRNQIKTKNVKIRHFNEVRKGIYQLARFLIVPLLEMTD